MIKILLAIMVTMHCHRINTIFANLDDIINHRNNVTEPELNRLCFLVEKIIFAKLKSSRYLR